MKNSKQSNNYLTISGNAYMDSIVSLNQIFKPNPNLKDKIDFEKISDGVRYRFQSTSQFGSTHLKIFIAILSVFSDFNSSFKVNKNCNNQEIGDLRKSLYKGIDDDNTILYSEFYVADILRIAGLNQGGTQIKQFLNVMENLSNFTISYQSDESASTIFLISYKLTKKKEEKYKKAKIKVVLNSVSSSIILGIANYARYLNVVDFSKLSSDPEIFTFVYLSWWVFEGKKSKISIDKLCRHIYLNFDELNESTQRSHRSSVRKALITINELDGWEIEITGRGKKVMVDVSRESSSARKKRMEDVVFPLLKKAANF
ncbi:replication protein C, IncQ-type [Endozoicomonas acroporae]|uniref:replication protein C, IncQ-type n=1 Tax=Endozoicomonas acroporae TaxID=1701104 RepID=UPI000C7936D5|nr:replication protein C, IncQ-type [Endozoicomonas acroporae]